MKSFRLLVVCGLIAVFAGLVVSSCDMPWDDDKKKTSEVLDPSPIDEVPVPSPIEPILGDFQYFFPTNAGSKTVMFDYEDKYGFDHAEGDIGDFEEGVWSDWVATLPQNLKTVLIPQAHDAENGIAYRLMLRMEETAWTLFVQQNDETSSEQPYYLHVWGMRGTHSLDRTSDDTRFQGNAAVTHVSIWDGTPPDPDWAAAPETMQFRVRIEADAFFILEKRYFDYQNFRCLFVDGDDRLFRSLNGAAPQIRFERIVQD